MSKLQEWQEGIQRRLNDWNGKTPVKIVQSGAYGLACGFYSYMTWETAKSVISAVSNSGIKLFPNANPKILMPFVNASSIFSLREGLSTATQTHHVLALAAVSATTLFLAVKCAQMSIKKSGLELHKPFVKPFEETPSGEVVGKVKPSPPTEPSPRKQD